MSELSGTEARRPQRPRCKGCGEEMQLASSEPNPVRQDGSEIQTFVCDCGSRLTVTRRAKDQP